MVASVRLLKQEEVGEAEGALALAATADKELGEEGAPAAGVAPQ